MVDPANRSEPDGRYVVIACNWFELGIKKPIECVFETESRCVNSIHEAKKEIAKDFRNKYFSKYTRGITDDTALR